MNIITLILIVPVVLLVLKGLILILYLLLEKFDK
jgi:hypothetical protein